MKPEDFRTISLNLGTIIGLAGGHDQQSPQDQWSGDKIIKCTLLSYIIVERHDFEYQIDGTRWDTGAIVIPFDTIEAKGHNLSEKDAATNYYIEKQYRGQKLLLIHRAPKNLATWGNEDLTVHVFGISDEPLWNETAITRNIWLPKAVWLASCATMIVEDPPSQSLLAQLLRKKYQSA